ncbi:hypothetical protein [Corallococcus sp. 4LFB]|uniref:hypothetical protein n=1 Tax=Corallococcus sp. 4LFB TaxID=3383249 RepID=UPI003976D324
MVACLRARSAGYGARFKHSGDDASRALDVLAARDGCVEHLGARAGGWRCSAVLVSTVNLSRVPRRPRPASTRLRALHGANDNLFAPERARREIEACFGSGALASAWSIFDGEGHHFHRPRSWAQVHAATVSLLDPF